MIPKKCWHRGLLHVKRGLLATLIGNTHIAAGGGLWGSFRKAQDKDALQRISCDGTEAAEASMWRLRKKVWVLHSANSAFQMSMPCIIAPLRHLNDVRWVVKELKCWRITFMAPGRALHIHIHRHIHKYVHACMHACMHAYIHTQTARNSNSEFLLVLGERVTQPALLVRVVHENRKSSQNRKSNMRLQIQSGPLNRVPV